MTPATVSVCLHTVQAAQLGDNGLEVLAGVVALVLCELQQALVLQEALCMLMCGGVSM